MLQAAGWLHGTAQADWLMRQPKPAHRLLLATLHLGGACSKLLQVGANSRGWSNEG